MAKLKCRICGYKIIPVSREKTICSGGCSYDGNTKELLELEIIEIDG